MKLPPNSKVLILTDIHQDIGYVNQVLAKETDFDYIIFNGDYFDTFKEPRGEDILGVSKMCEWIESTRKRFGDKAIWHIGNHDLAYLVTYTPDYTKSKPNRVYSCSGWTGNKAKKFNKYINPEWFKDLHLSTFIGDNIVVSHAGYHNIHFRPMLSETANIEWYQQSWDETKLDCKYNAFHWIYDVGMCRGGYAKIGGPVWLDWECEFQPLETIQQIVGHSTTSNLTELRCKRNKQGLENWCIDYVQRGYMIVENGNMEMKFI